MSALEDYDWKSAVRYTQLREKARLRAEDGSYEVQTEGGSVRINDPIHLINMNFDLKNQGVAT